MALVTEWWGAFAGDADELRAGQLRFWVTETGAPVRLTRATPPSALSQ